jgi:hypothetical protein
MEVSGKLTSPEILQKGLAVIICIFGTSYLPLPIQNRYFSLAYYGAHWVGI